jgi:hypothetical protein
MAHQLLTMMSFVAIDHATYWVFIAINNKSVVSVRVCLKALTDNGGAFTDPLFALRERQPGGHPEFDPLSKESRTEERRTQPKIPNNDGVVARLKGHMVDLLKALHFVPVEGLVQTLPAM